MYVEPAAEGANEADGPLSPSWARGHVAAPAAGAVRFRPVELLVGARDRILAVVGDLLDALVQLRTALVTKPGEAIALAGAALALEHQHEGIGREARRVRRAGRAVDDLAFLNHGDLLIALRRPVVEVHVALDHVHDLVARIAVELAAELAAPRDERDAVGRLPEDGVGPARTADRAHDLTQVDCFHLVHDYSFVTFSTRRSKPLGCRRKPLTLARVATTWTSWSTNTIGASSTIRRWALR